MWWKRKAEKESTKTPDGIVSRIAGVMNRMHNRLGETLNKKTLNLNRRGKIGLLFLICLILGGGSLYVLIAGLKDNHSPDLIKPKAIRVPSHVNKTGDPAPANGVTNVDDIKRIKSIRDYLHRLQQTTGGQRTYDSILHVRPGFMDSLRQVERLYGIDTAVVDE